MEHEKKLIVNGSVALPDHVSQISLSVEGGKIKALLDEGMDVLIDCKAIDALGKTVVPGMIDSHNHVADPGPHNFKGDWYCGSCSVTPGGITTIRDMPFLSEPATIDRPGFELKKGIAEQRSIVGFTLWGRLIPSNIKDMKKMHDLSCTGLKGFTCFATGAYSRITNGYPVDGMRMTASFDGLITLHTENVEMVDFRCQHYSRIRYEDEVCFDDARPRRIEYNAIRRAVLPARMTGVRLETCHITVSQEAEFPRNARKEGTRIHVETCPHYPIFDRDVLREKKSFARCTPPFCSRENIEKMWGYVMGGTIDVIGSDRGPYTDEKKVRTNDFWKEFYGFGCNDVILAAIISEGVNRGGLSWEKPADLISANAAEALELYPRKGNLLPGAGVDFIFIDPNKNWVYDGSKSLSKTKSVKGPYQRMELKDRVTDIYVRGERVYGDGKIPCQTGYGAFARYEA